MKRFIIGFACLILLPGFGALKCPAQSSVAGEWAGGYEIKGNYTPIKTRFNLEGSVIKGTLDFPQRQVTGAALDQVKFQSPNLHFELPRDAGPLIFEGQLSGGLITGSVQSGNDRGTFHLVHSVLAKSFEEYLGDYQLARDSYVSIWRFPGGDFAGGVMYEVKDLSRFVLRSGYLFPISETAFVAGPAQFEQHPVEINATFVKDEQGQVTALKWTATGSPEMLGKKVKPHFCAEEEVKFSNGNVTLAGTLCRPLREGRQPAVIMIDGSGGGLRGWKGLAQFFAQHGIAALTYDKRGFGASTGTIVGATVNDMAGDAAAGVRYLQNRPDIDPRKVGVWGISQGGWIAPVVATTTPNVAFIILHAGPAVSPRVQARHDLENTLRRSTRGYSPDEIKEALAYQGIALDAMNSDEAYDKLKAANEQAKARGARWVGSLSTKEQMRARWIRPNVDFDPVPVLEKVKCPVIAFFGEKDGLVPPEGNVSIMEAALKKAGNKDVTIKVLPGVGHMLSLPSGKTPPGYYDVMIAWVKKRVAPALRFRRR